MSIQNSGVVAADERAQIAALLARYPDGLSPSELEEIHNWFDRVATPLDLGLLAGDPEVAAQYRAYRAEHVDKFKPRDIGKAIVFVGAIVAVASAITLLAP